MNKFLAKVASDYQKPNGLSVILPDQVQGFIDALEIDKFHGIGKVTAAKMHEMGIHTGADLKKYSERKLVRLFGKPGKFYHQIAHGIDDRPVNPNRVRKSISTEITFDEDIRDQDRVQMELSKIVKKVMEWMAKHETYGRTATLKVKFNDFQQITRSKTHSGLIDNHETLLEIAEVLRLSVNDPRPIRLLGLGMSNLNNQPPGEEAQLTLGLSY